MKNRSFLSFAVALLLAVGVSAVSCSETDEPIPVPADSGILLLSACSNDALQQMVCGEMPVAGSIGLFDSEPSECIESIKSADLIFLLVSGDRMDIENSEDALRRKWDAILRPVADKIIIIYDGTLETGNAAAKLVGVDAGPGYYIKAMGPGRYCKMLAPDELTPQTLVESIRLVQGNAALGASEDERVQTFRFVKTARFACLQSSDVRYDAEPRAPYLYEGETLFYYLSDAEIRRSFIGNFLVEYTVYTASDAKEKYVQIDLKGGGFTSHMTCFENPVTVIRNMPITYYTVMSVSGAKDKILPVVKKVLPVSDNRSASVSESSDFNIGFTGGKDLSLSFGYSWSNTVSYEQSEWETTVSYERDVFTNTVSQMWKTRPVFTWGHYPGKWDGWRWTFESDGMLDFIAWGSIYDARADWPDADKNFSHIYYPREWAVTYRDFQPRQSMLVMTEGNSLDTKVEIGAVLQSSTTGALGDKYWVYGYNYDLKAECRQNIVFSDYIFE